jgi:hypothetical protein
MNTEISPVWIAACAHHLQLHWRTVDPRELALVAAELAHDEHLGALAPDVAAAEWLAPVEAKAVAWRGD